MSNLVVNTNVLSLQAHRSMKVLGSDQAKASAKLSTGERINTAADDAAGLAISEKMRSQIRGLDMACRNIQDGISMLQTADGALAEVTDMYKRARELSVQGMNDTYTTEDLDKILNEIWQVGQAVEGVALTTEFNGHKIFMQDTQGWPGRHWPTISIQTGANSGDSTKLFVHSSIASEGDNLNYLYHDDIKSGFALRILDRYIESVIEDRAVMGAQQNRLEYTLNSNQIQSENLSSSESRIRDTDMAKEMIKLTRTNILQQASSSMLAQSNSTPENLLQLLR